MFTREELEMMETINVDHAIAEASDEACNAMSSGCTWG
jgi:hypothetical protein